MIPCDIRKRLSFSTIPLVTCLCVKSTPMLSLVTQSCIPEKVLVRSLNGSRCIDISADVGDCEGANSWMTSRRFTSGLRPIDLVAVEATEASRMLVEDMIICSIGENDSRDSAIVAASSSTWVTQSIKTPGMFGSFESWCYPITFYYRYKPTKWTTDVLTAPFSPSTFVTMDVSSLVWSSAWRTELSIFPVHLCY